jgi:hypothetical protein
VIRARIAALRGRLRRLVRAIYGASIWHPDAIPESEGTASAELKRYVLPAFDLLIVVMGVAGIARGMPSFTAVFDAGVSIVAGWALLAAGIAALVGISFPRLWMAEAVGKITMLIVIGGYASALWVLNFEGVGQRWIVAVAFTLLLVLPVWTLSRLGRERRARQAAAARGEGGS